MKAAAIVGVAAAVLIIGGVVAVTSTDDRRTGATEPVQSLSSPTASRVPLNPAAQRYLDAVEAKDADALAATFAPDGLVVDVGREIRGRDAIRQWAANEVIGGVYTLLDHTPRAGGVTMLVRFQPGGTGGFRANYHFDIADGSITKATLEYA
ncbi:nuclear transport factor 2 family protein [Kribbella solani]|uniref:nuclear transport factor 2 family protein n=1 Tax=Kribbella solani TaxID=236067 RepID=UPI0029B48AF2|nr:nuclear transport factor 2 family protein [Kribbella solani]MDX3006570.1 nuclear transport factor 2 family protein [Kribbella solani]